MSGIIDSPFVLTTGILTKHFPHIVLKFRLLSIVSISSANTSNDIEASGISLQLPLQMLYNP